MAHDQKHLLVIARLIAGALIGGGDAPAGQVIAGYVEVLREAEASGLVNRLPIVRVTMHTPMPSLRPAGKCPIRRPQK